MNIWSCRCSKGPEGRGLRALGTKLVFLKCTAMGEGLQKTKIRFARKPGRTRWPSWVSHNPDCSFNLQPLFTHLNVSDSRADLLTHYKGVRMAEIWHWGIIFCRSRMDVIHMCRNLYRFSCCCCCLKVSQGTPIVRFKTFSVALSFDDTNFRRWENNSKKLVYLLPISYWGPRAYHTIF